MKDSSICSFMMCLNLIDSIRYGLMGFLQFHEMACMDSAPCSLSSPDPSRHFHNVHLHNVHLRRTLHGEKNFSL